MIDFTHSDGAVWTRYLTWEQKSISGITKQREGKRISVYDMC